MARGKDLYIGSTLVHHIYNEDDKIYHIYKGSQEIWRDRRFNKGETVFEKQIGGIYTVELDSGLYDVICVGGGGAAAMRGVYDDKGYGWSGGSGSAFVGRFSLNHGVYTIVVGSANNNTKPQGGNTNTLNPDDMTTHDSSISGVVTCGGGGSGHYNPNYVGAAGASPVLSLSPVLTTLNTAGNTGNYASGGKGSSAGPRIYGGASVYAGFGEGQGCRPSEYSSGRRWFDGTSGYVKIVYVEDNLQS